MYNHVDKVGIGRWIRFFLFYIPLIQQIINSLSTPQTALFYAARLDKIGTYPQPL